MSDSFLQIFRRMNVQRCEGNFHRKLTDWSETDWGCAIAGEMGELCNLLKKRHRSLLLKDSIPDEEVGKEISDVITYLDLLAARLGFSLEDLIRDKFNEVSQRVGFEEKL